MTTAWLSSAAIMSMEEEADRHYPLETGGVLVGYWVTSTELVILEASGPGVAADHRSHGFKPDDDYHIRWIADRYRSSEGTHTYLGDWHTHPNAKAAVLSSADRRTLRAIADHKEARAPTPVLVIMVGKDGAWSSTCFLGRYKRLLGIYRSFGLEPCPLRTFDHSV